MRSLALLPPAVAALLREFPYDFLYGSIAADTSIAKKYAPAGRHCHSWNVGMEIFDGARDDPLRAFGLGYLAHLAADSVAHNYFVPKQLAVTTSTSGFGHSYWESRFETHLGPGVRPPRARADSDRSFALRRSARSRAESDDLQHADEPPNLSRHGDRRRQRVVAAHLSADDGEQPLGSAPTTTSADTSRDRTTSSWICCMRMDGAEPFQLDPSGDHALRMAKRVRRQVLRAGRRAAPARRGRSILRHADDARSPSRRGSREPLYAPSRSASN